MSDDEREAFERAFGEVLQPGEVLTGWCVVASLMDVDGVQRLYSATMDGQTASTDIGLLRYGLIGAERHVERLWDREFDDDGD